MNREDLDACESCEGLFDPDKMERSGDQSFCSNCHHGILKEIRATGIKHLDKYLATRNLKEDFHVFAHSMWSGVTEEEFRELNPE